MISTKDFSKLPDRYELERICKAISVLDAILSQDWEYRYYSYNSKWAEGEECMTMRNGSGDEMLILFTETGCVINGLAHEYEQPDKTKVTQGLPDGFREFIFGEPVKSIGTTFCLWTNDGNPWKSGTIAEFADGSEELLSIFDGNPQTYVDYATDYFEESLKASGIPLQTVAALYEGKPLTKEMALSIVDDLEDWEQLEKDLEEMGYPYDFN